MLRANAKTDIRSMNALHVVCTVLAILPPAKLSNVEDYKVNRLYGLLVTCLFLAGFVLTAYGKVALIWPLMTSTGMLLDAGADLSLILVNVVAIGCVNLHKGLEVCQFLASIRRIDHDFRHVAASCEYPNKGFVTEMILLHVYSIFTVGCSAFFWVSSVGVEYYLLVVLRDVQNYFTLMLAMLLRTYALAIKHRLEVLNELLSACRWTDGDGIFLDSEKLWHRWTLPKIAQIYTRLANVLDQYNAIFGWLFVALLVSIEVNLLVPLNTALVYGNDERDFNGLTFGWDLKAMCLVWTSLPLVTAVLIFSACHHAADEMHRTSAIAYTLSQELGAESRELQEFALLASNRCPTFSAAGFFDVSFSVLFAQIVCMTSYFIVLLQFK